MDSSTQGQKNTSIMNEEIFSLTQSQEHTRVPVMRKIAIQKKLSIAVKRKGIPPSIVK